MPQESKASQVISKKMSEIEPGTPRYEMLEAARRFKRSWVEMGEKLSDVQRRKLHEQWGYPRFEAYCQQELRIKPQTALKLTASYFFLKQDEPALLRRDGVERPVPDVEVVDFLRRLQEKQRVEPKEYSRIKQMAYQQQATPGQLRQELNKVAPPESPPRAEVLRQLVDQAKRLADRLAAVAGIPRAIVDRALALVDDLREMLAGHRPADG